MNGVISWVCKHADNIPTSTYQIFYLDVQCREQQQQKEKKKKRKKKKSTQLLQLNKEDQGENVFSSMFTDIQHAKIVVINQINAVNKSPSHQI